MMEGLFALTSACHVVVWPIGEGLFAQTNCCVAIMHKL